MQACHAMHDKQTKPTGDIRSRWAWRAGLAGVLAIGLALLTVRITGPFTGWHEWNSAFFGYFARNHLRYGLGYTHLLCTHGSTADPPAQPSYYLSHPPLIAAWVAISMALFGQQEWAIRLVPIVASLGSIGLVAGIVRRTHGWRLGLATAFFFAVAPATAYFGRMADHVPLVQFFGLLMLYGYLAWCGIGGVPRRWGLGVYLLGCVLGIGTGWAAVLFAAAIGIWHGVRCLTGRGRWARLAVLVAAPGLTLAAVLVHILWALDWQASVFVPLFTTRSFGQRLGMPPSWTTWLKRLGEFWRRDFTLAGAAAVLVLLAGRLAARTPAGPIKRWTDKLLPGPKALWVPAAAGVVYVVLFRNQSFIHEYWQVFLTPFVAYSLAAVLVAIWELLGRVHPAVGATVGLAWMAGVGALCGVQIKAFHGRSHYPLDEVKMWRIVNERTPPHAPVMTFRNYHYRERFGPYVHDYIQPQAAYYADRPLIYERNPRWILANRQGCVLYVLPWRHLPGGLPKRQMVSLRNAMYQFLKARYRIIPLRLGGGKVQYLLAVLKPQALRGSVPRR